jgi:hypothetical protein
MQEMRRQMEELRGALRRELGDDADRNRDDNENDDDESDDNEVKADGPDES